MTTVERWSCNTKMQQQIVKFYDMVCKQKVSDRLIYSSIEFIALWILEAMYNFQSYSANK